MNITSTYTKSFFLPGKSFTKTGSVIDFNVFKRFSILNEELVTENCASKKDIDLTRNVVWICPKCGHTHVGALPTSNCPICNSHYIINENK